MSSSIDLDKEKLPPYSSSDIALPPYSPAPSSTNVSTASTAVAQTPVTYPYAMYIFAAGCLFPPLWLLGALAIVVPLRLPFGSRPPGNNTGTHTEIGLGSEAEQLSEKQRRAEISWGKRCLVALMLTFCIALAIGLSVWGGSKFANAPN